MHTANVKDSVNNKQHISIKADTHEAGDKPFGGLTMTAPSAVRYKPVVFGSANVAMNEPRASNAAMRTYRSTKNGFNTTSIITRAMAILQRLPLLEYLYFYKPMPFLMQNHSVSRQQ